MNLDGMYVGGWVKCIESRGAYHSVISGAAAKKEKAKDKASASGAQESHASFYMCFYI